MKSRLLMLALSGLLTASIGLVGKVGCQNMELKDRTSQLNAELMSANTELGRANTQFGDAEKYASQLEDEIVKEINKRKAAITRYGELRARFKRLKTSKVKTTITYEEKIVEVPTTRDVTRGMLYEAVTNKTLVMVTQLTGKHEDELITIEAGVFPYPNYDRDFPFKFDYRFELGFDIQFVETHLPTGAINHYARVWVLNKDDKRVQELDIEKFDMVVKLPAEKQFYWWAPHLDVGALLTAQATPLGFMPGGSLGISAMGYGKTVNDLDWRFLRLSMDLVSDRPGMGFSPALYNFGQELPLISNLWVGPHLTYILPETWGLGFVIGAVL